MLVLQFSHSTIIKRLFFCTNILNFLSQYWDFRNITLWTNQVKGAITVIIYDIQHQVFWIHLICLYGAFTSSPLLGCSLSSSSGTQNNFILIQWKFNYLTFSFALWKKILPVPCEILFAQKSRFAQTVYHSTCLTFFFFCIKETNKWTWKVSPRRRVKVTVPEGPSKWGPQYARFKWKNLKVFKHANL